MTQEIPQGQEPAPATSELPNGAAAAPVDGAVVAAEPQQAQEPAQAADDDDTGETPKHRKASYRFSELSRQLRSKAEEAAYWRGIAEARANGQAPPQAQPQPHQPVADADPEPSPASYAGKEFDPAYLREVAAWAGRQEARKLQEQSQKDREAATARSAEERAHQEGLNRFMGARDEAAELEETNPQLTGVVVDTLDRIARAEPPGTPGRLIDVVTKADNKGWVAAALATKPGLLQQIQALDPIARALAIGKIDAQISANLASSARAQPAASPPVQPAPVAPSNSPALAQPPQLNGGGASVSYDPNKGSMDDYYRWRQQQEQQQQLQ